jgi:PTS system nitrogen regulatory IIA component
LSSASAERAAFSRHVVFIVACARKLRWRLARPMHKSAGRDGDAVKLTVREAARLLSVSESEIYRWIDDGDMPCHVVNHQPLFSRAELLEWATARRLPVSVKLFEDDDGGPEPVRLADALERGGVHQGIRGTDRQSVLRSMVAELPLGDDQDRDLLFEVLLAREALGSTAIGDGIAIPHVRSPLVFAGSKGALALCYLESPVAFDAPDQQPVHTLFALVSPTIRGHLQLLSRLSLALLDAGFRAAVLRRADLGEIVSEARRVEEALPSDAETTGRQKAG